MGRQIRVRILGLAGIVCLTACAIAQGQAAQSETETAKATDALIREANVFYLRHEYKNAIPLYQKALDLQKKQPTIDKAAWRELVDNLGEAYGISGDLKRAKATYAYGLEKDPKYWLFHYDMACTYAEMNDVDHAIFHIKRAFEYKEKSMKIADPWTDRSFQGLMNNDKFVNALREIDIHE